MQVYIWQIQIFCRFLSQQRGGGVKGFLNNVEMNVIWVQGRSSMAIAHLFFFEWIFIQKLTLHNSSSLMTMCPSILAPICASLLSGESVKLRGLKRSQCVQCAQCRADVAIKGHLVRHVSIEEEQLSLLISTAGLEPGANRAVMWELSVYMSRLCVDMAYNGKQMHLILVLVLVLHCTTWTTTLIVS